jgi:hypothetical protein
MQHARQVTDQLMVELHLLTSHVAALKALPSGSTHAQTQQDEHHGRPHVCCSVVGTGCRLVAEAAECRSLYTRC